MKEGAWINGKTLEFFWIDEHCEWIRRHDNALRLGLSEEQWEKISEMPPNDFYGSRREAILLTIMGFGSYIRIRGQGTLYVFEFTCDTSKIFMGVYNFCQRVAGEHTVLRLNNLCTQETIELPYWRFKQLMGEDESEILRMATAIPVAVRSKVPATQQLTPNPSHPSKPLKCESE